MQHPAILLPGSVLAWFVAASFLQAAPPSFVNDVEPVLTRLGCNFGRTPKIKKDSGRDHWAHAASLVFAGAGVRGRQVIGQTDKHGAHATRRPVAPADVACILYETLGIDPRKLLPAPDGRPQEILDKGETVRELFR